jgi:hypothetical protein
LVREELEAASAQEVAAMTKEQVFSSSRPQLVDPYRLYISRPCF